MRIQILYGRIGGIVTGCWEGDDECHWEHDRIRGERYPGAWS